MQWVEHFRGRPGEGKTYAGATRIRRPLGGIKVEIIGTNLRTEVVTDAHGRFVAADFLLLVTN